MEIQLLKEHIKPLMKQERYEHSLGVADFAATLAQTYGVDVKKAQIAGILHDCAKEFDYDTMHQYLARADIDEVVAKSPKLWHGPAGAVYAKEKFDIDDEIYDAIYYHTIGREEMAPLTKIIFLADTVEIGRDKEFDWAKDIRQLAGQNIDEAVVRVIDETTVSLIKRGYTMHINSVLCRNKILFDKR